MPKYSWEATNRAGEVKKGTIEAADEAAVANRLKADNLTPRRIRTAKRGGQSPRAPRNPRSRSSARSRRRRRKT